MGTASFSSRTPPTRQRRKGPSASCRKSLECESSKTPAYGNLRMTASPQGLLLSVICLRCLCIGIQSSARNIFHGPTVNRWESETDLLATRNSTRESYV